MSGYVYKQTEPGLWTVGHYDDDNGRWKPESDHGTPGEAAERAAWLNGGPLPGADIADIEKRAAVRALLAEGERGLAAAAQFHDDDPALQLLGKKLLRDVARAITARADAIEAGEVTLP